MIYEFRLPDIGEGVAEGEVVRWLVKEGDTLVEDQPMVEVMTDKATVEIGSPRAGRVAKRMFAEGERCPVGKVLITIDVEGEGQAGGQAGRPRPRTAPKAAARGCAGRTQAGNGAAARRRGAGDAGHAQTRARHRRRYPRGRRQRAAPDGSPPTTSGRTARGGAGRAAPERRPRRARTACGFPSAGCAGRSPRQLVRSKHTAPHVTYVEEIDCTELVALRAKVNARGGEKLSFLPFIIKATIAALRKYPADERHARRRGRRDHPVEAASTSASRRRRRTGSSCR